MIAVARRTRLVAAAALAAAVLAACAACAVTSAGHGSALPAALHTSAGARSSPAATRSAPPVVDRVSVHVSVNIADGQSVGVGMPYIAMFDRTITDGRAFAQATKVTVNGAAADARWYFEPSAASSGHAMEAHLRLQRYWPAHARIHVDLPVNGLSGGAVPRRAGAQYTFADSITSDFETTAAHVVSVSDATHTMTVTDDGKLWGTFPVSLGAANTPTKRGIKVIMEKGRVVRMRGPGYDDPHVEWTQRLTYDGEYLHSAPWNCVGPPGCAGPANNIGHADSSNGCTNLRPQDAIKLYNFLGIGDPVEELDTAGPKMQLGWGYGDWNISWALWQSGGAVPTH